MVKVELEQPIVDGIKAMLEGAAGAAIADYRGLTVERDTQLHKQLREVGVAYEIYKNILTEHAAERTDLAVLASQLEGPTALAVPKEDATTPACTLANFARIVPELGPKASVVKETYYGQTRTQAIATIPPREELLDKLLGNIQSLITNLTRVFDQIAEQQGGVAEA